MPYLHRDPHSYWVYGVYSCSTHQVLQLIPGIEIFTGGPDRPKPKPRTKSKVKSKPKVKPRLKPKP
jgi:hypothetical protein